MIQGFAFFPSIVYRDEHPEWVDYLLKISKKYFTTQDILCQTNSMEKDFEIKFLIDYLLNTSQEILLSQGYSMDQCELYVSGLWGQEIKQFGGTDTHVHKNSQLCGWIFLETPKDGSYPIYYDVRSNKKMIELNITNSEEITNATSSIHFNNIIPGTLLISNSWMEHRLTVNMANESTKSIHFVISHRDKICSML